jgi:nucleoside-diphosphate-sugar epimerase
MKLLVLGGTAWLGHELARQAWDAGHEVTCLARGSTGTVPAGTRLVAADRDAPGAYDTVAREPWDAVVDLARQPAQAAEAAQALAGCGAHHVLVSSVSVYADSATPAQDETAPLLEPLPAERYTDPADYGPAKVACEQRVRAVVGASRLTCARPGLIGGPGDISDRTGYWPLRFATAAADQRAAWQPAAEGLWTQIIDVRDLAAWLLRAALHRLAGDVNLVGDSVPLADWLAQAREVAGHRGPLLRAPDAWLQQQGLRPWAGPRSVPLWVPGEAYAGFGRWRGERARALGLTVRPMRETIADTLRWEQSRPAPAARKAGLSDDDDHDILRRLTT